MYTFCLPGVRKVLVFFFLQLPIICAYRVEIISPIVHDFPSDFVLRRKKMTLERFRISAAFRKCCPTKEYCIDLNKW